MASTTITCNLPSGLSSPVLKLAAVGAPDTLVNGVGDTLTEQTNLKGWYAATVTEALADLHLATLEDSASNVLATGYVSLADDTGNYLVVEQCLLSVGAKPGELSISSGKVPATIAAGDLATDSITADVLQADAVAELQNGLATASALATVDGNVDAIRAVTDEIPDAGAMTSLAMALATVDGNVNSILEDTAEIGPAGAGLTNIHLPDQEMNITGNLSGSVGSVTGGINTAAGEITTLDGLDTAQDAEHDATQALLATIAAYIDTEVAAIKAVTDAIPDSGAMSSIATAAALATVDANVDSVLEDTAELQAAWTDGGRLDLLVDAIQEAIQATGVALSAATINTIADGLLDRTDGVEPASSGTSRTLRQALRLILAASVGKLSGAAGAQVMIRDPNDTKNRIVAAVDSSGNRTSVTLNDS
ncbi:hypothetical protein [Lignipirellula cremea]|uniref:Uncharacterized protein n=1 Tax=Lignipirellula cremea TaxID=2528010 RepID=A0A518E091_9BACT|nr:hypothetical protein [Lignipirellula cremea]QDU97516.1 hypothetical protein Pla8534_53640 [Lignipirellula cremea]